MASFVTERLAGSSIDLELYLGIADGAALQEGLAPLLGFPGERLDRFHPLSMLVQTYLIRSTRFTRRPRHVPQVSGMLDRFDPPGVSEPLAVALGLDLAEPAPHPYARLLASSGRRVALPAAPQRETVAGRRSAYVSAWAEGDHWVWLSDPAARRQGSDWLAEALRGDAPVLRHAAIGTEHGSTVPVRWLRSSRPAESPWCTLCAVDPLYVLPGLLVALAGRRLFWLAFALAGFLAGFRLAAEAVADPAWLATAVGIAVGVVAAVLAVFLEGLALAAAAFLAGVLLTVDLAAALGFAAHPQIWLAWIVGGALALVLAMAILPWALAVVSAVLGGLLVAEGLPWPPPLRLAVFAVVSGAGILIQVQGIGPPNSGKKPSRKAATKAARKG